MDLFSPSTQAEAVALAASVTPTFPIPSQDRLFTRPLLETLFDRGARRPDLVWAARDDGQVLGLLGARTSGQSFGLVDLVALPRSTEAASAVVGAATAWAGSQEKAEATFGTPAAERPLDDPAVRTVVDAFVAHGWRVLVTRRHYEFEPASGLGDDVPLHARLERATESDRDRLEALVRQVLPGSLDVRDQAEVAERGLDAVAARFTAELLDDDPIECVRFGVIDGQDAGVVIHRVMPSGTGYLAFVGVASAFRGRGLAPELVAAATREMIADGARTLVADTDDDNWPMARAFASVGWPQSESRIDLTLEG